MSFAIICQAHAAFSHMADDAFSRKILIDCNEMKIYCRRVYL